MQPELTTPTLRADYYAGNTASIFIQVFAGLLCLGGGIALAVDSIVLIMREGADLWIGVVDAAILLSVGLWGVLDWLFGWFRLQIDLEGITLYRLVGSPRHLAWLEIDQIKASMTRRGFLRMEIMVYTFSGLRSYKYPIGRGSDPMNHRQLASLLSFAQGHGGLKEIDQVFGLPVLKRT